MDPFFECEDCGKQYPAPRFVVEHQRTRCTGTKRTFHAVLEGAREVWEARKRKRTAYHNHTVKRPTSMLPSEPDASYKSGSSTGRAQVELEETHQPISVSCLMK
jgi:hypothetical protein